MTELVREALPTVFRWNLLPATSLRPGMFLVDKSDTSRTSVIVSEPKLVNEGQDVHISLSEGVSFSASVNSLMCVARVGEA